MKKADLIKAIQRVQGGKGVDIAKTLEAIAEVAADHMTRGEVFAIPGVVKLTPTIRAARQGRNPATGETVQLAEKKVIKAKGMTKHA